MSLSVVVSIYPSIHSSIPSTHPCFFPSHVQVQYCAEHVHGKTFKAASKKDAPPCNKCGYELQKLRTLGGGQLLIVAYILYSGVLQMRNRCLVRHQVHTHGRSGVAERDGNKRR